MPALLFSKHFFWKSKSQRIRLVIQDLDPQGTLKLKLKFMVFKVKARLFWNYEFQFKCWNHAKFQFFSRSKPWKTSNFKARIRQAFSRGSWKNQGLNIFIFWESFKGEPWETLKFKVFSRWKLEKTWTSSQGLGQDF